MRWSPLLSVVIGLSFIAGRLLSQETAADQRPDPAEAWSPSLLRETGATHFHLVLGRLQLDPTRYRKGTHNRQSPPGGDPRSISESLSVDAQRGVPTVHYCRQTPTRTLTLDINARGQLQLESTAASDASRVIVIQQVGRPISIRRFQGDHCEEHLFATWIHLYVATETLYSEHFESLIDDMLYPVRLSDLAQRAHARSLAELSGTHAMHGDDPSAIPFAQPRIDNPTLHHWIASLGSTRRTQRIEAERRLHEQGISLLPRLHQIDHRSLDAEQSERLKQLTRQLTPRSDDNEARVATLIRDDSSYWAAAADRLSGHEQSLIAARLSSLDGPPRERVATLPPDASGRR